MASIFTFDPDPPRVSSPWSTPRTRTPKPLGTDGQEEILPSESEPTAESSTSLSITKLEAEPQEGPTEYKLHLLLRQRRSFTTNTTGSRISGSHRSASGSPTPRSISEARLSGSPSLQARSNQTRQQRLEQLTTQLLWRLQQSCPHHSASYKNQITPYFPDASKLGASAEIGRVIPGLEESKGALYEIGVADDGTFIGLAKDEMEESITTLRAMAASLGCVVEVLRMVSVGECEWLDETSGERLHTLKRGKLWVAEAYVKPNLGPPPPLAKSSKDFGSSSGLDGKSEIEQHVAEIQLCAQLKVSLTGATMSGKSSLLGSLTTATLDNGRGKSRLSLLKHRHEIASGMTSSVTQELLGYCDTAYLAAKTNPVEIVNYASGNVSSWIDIHGSCESGRLVLLSDSAGHPRFRRTTIRGLVGWAPDWTLLCIPADNTEDTTGMTGSTPPSEEVLGIASVDVDLTQPHIDLCLKLNLPLVIIITKLDLASKAGLRNCLVQVLSTLKAAGRKPVILANPNAPTPEGGLSDIPAGTIASCESIAASLRSNPLENVPIILTSAVKGTGITTLHALLYELPIPGHSTPNPDVHQQCITPLFHIEDTYTSASNAGSEGKNPVLSGHLRYGKINVGDELLLGPYLTEGSQEDRDMGASANCPKIPTSRSFPGALSRTRGLPLPGSLADEEWRKVRVTSLRNLRLPIRTLFAGQVGTVGVQPVDSTISSPALVRIRKGMVLAKGSPQAKRGFVAEFARKDVESFSIGMGVVVYVASVRASAKVVSGAIPDDESPASLHDRYRDEEEGFGFAFEEDESSQAPIKREAARLLVSFQFIASREYVENGWQVLVIPGGGPGLYGGQERGEKGVAGLDGVVGQVFDGFG